MLKWLANLGDRSNAAAQTPFDFETLQKQAAAVVFKHSRTCPVSWAAQTQVQKFIASHPAIPVYTLVVQEERELSRRLAELTGIRHASPQVIIFRQGEAVANESHEGVTADYLAAITT